VPDESYEPPPSPVHFVAHFKIDDEAGYEKYVAGFFKILAGFGGRFVTFDDNPTILEGERVEGRTVILKFESEEDCLTWWNSPEYRELAKLRHASTTTHSAVMVHAAS